MQSSPAVHTSLSTGSRNPRCIPHRHATYACGRLQRRPAALKAASDEDRASSTISSLDSLLGSSSWDEHDRPSSIPPEPPTQLQPQLPAIPTAYLQKLGIYNDAQNVSVPRRPPVLSVVLYYWSIVLYLASVYLNAVEGPGAGDDFTESLANDHLAVTQGHEYLRLLTSPLVHHSPLSLLITLVALGLVGAELEATAGYFAFACIAVLGAVAAGMADIWVADLPVTQGAVPAISAMVTALFVNQLKNSSIKEQATAALAAAQQQQQLQQQALLQGTSSSGSTTDILPNQLVSTADSQQQQALQDVERNASGADASASAAANGISNGSQPGSNGQALQQGKDATEGGKPAYAEVEFLEGLFKVEVASSPAVKTVVAGATTFIACFEALSDLQDDGNVTTSIAGIVAGMVAGAALSAALGPQYEAVCLQESKVQEDLGRKLPDAWVPVGGSSVARDRLFIRIRDRTPWVVKLLVALGSTAALAAALKVA